MRNTLQAFYIKMLKNSTAFCVQTKVKKEKILFIERVNGGGEQVWLT